MKNKLILISSLILFIAILIVVKNNPLPTISNTCKNKTFTIASKLESGEEGKVFIDDNRCEFVSENNDLNFEVMENGAIQDTVYRSSLYIWNRNELSLEKQIQQIIDDRSKSKTCSLHKSDQIHRDGLESYYSDCWLFGQQSDFAFENFISTNNLIIGYRQEGLDGIAPFNFASIHFQQN